MYDFDEIIDRKNTDSIKHDRLKAIFGTEDVIPMWVADMDFKTPDFIMKQVRERADHEVLGYSFRGESFYQSVISWLKKRHQWEVKKDWITFSPGVVPALTMLVNAFTQPGDKIIVQSPVYFPFYTSILNTGRQLINNELKLKNEKYYMDFDDLKKQIDSRTKMVLLCSPHNPVGRVWTKDELLQLGQICLQNEVLIVADEIHSDIIFNACKHTPIAAISEELANITISTYAPSKTFNLAGMSTSVLVIPNKKLKIKYENYIGDFHLHMGNIFGSVALEAAYNQGDLWLQEMIAYIEENTGLVREFAVKHKDKLALIEPEATYLLWLDFRKLKLDDDELKTFIINKAKLGLNPGIMFGSGGEGFQRMNVACPRSVIKQALQQLESAFRQI
ncbi:MAG: PatB family C-S lyase [Bacteroidales bacterium]|nr:PatB family C-S lyase [Bacteroidales bacterium]